VSPCLILFELLALNHLATLGGDLAYLKFSSDVCLQMTCGLPFLLRTPFRNRFTPKKFIQVDYYGIMLCIPSALKMNRWYQLMICILGYVFPLLLILFCYVGVLSTLRKSAQNLPKPSRSKNRMDSRKRVTTIVVIIVSTRVHVRCDATLLLENY